MNPPTPSPPPDEPDAVVSRVRQAVDSIPTTSTDSGLRRVRRIADDRRRRHRLSAMAAAAAVVAVGAAAVVAVSGAPGNDDVMTPVASLPQPPVAPTTVDVPTTTIDPPSTSEPATAEPTIAPQTAVDDHAATVAPTETPETFDVEPVPLPTPDGVTSMSAEDRVFDFGDGFLVANPTMISAPGFELTVQEAQVLVGLDLAIMIEDSGATTPEEAIDVARRAGRVDDVERALAEQPQVLDALLNHRWTPGLDVHTTIDGTSWESVVLELPVEEGRVVDIASDGEHLVVAVTHQPITADRPHSDVTVTIMTTSDLESWSVETWTVPDPAGQLDGPVMALSGPGDLVAGDSGWAFALNLDVELDTFAVAEGLVDGELGGVGGSFGEDVVSIEATPRDGTPARFELTWEELGFDEDEARALRTVDPATVWSAPWGGAAPTRFEAEQSGFVRLAALPGGFAAFDDSSLTIVDIGATPHLLLPPASERIGSVHEVGDEVIVVTASEDDTSTVYRLDPDARTWIPLAVAPFPSEVSLSFWEPTGWPTRAVTRSPYVHVASTSSWEQNGFVYTWMHDWPISSYEVRSPDGEIIVAEEVDLQTIEGSFDFAYEHLRGGTQQTTIVDPATGDVLIDMSTEETAAMNAAATQLDGSPLPDTNNVPSDFWLVAAFDDGRWFVRELPPPDMNTSPTLAGAINGERMLVHRNGAWERYDL